MTDETNNELRRTHLYISGEVQGVFFRGATRERARELGLAGWVKNLPDGRVEAIFEGSPEDVRQMVQWCEKGPSHASVRDVQVEDEATEGDMRGFEVL